MKYSEQPEHACDEAPKRMEGPLPVSNAASFRSVELTDRREAGTPSGDSEHMAAHDLPLHILEK